MPPLPELLRAYILLHHPARPVFQEIHAGCQQLLRRMPESWYALAQRSEESVLSLADEVFFVCDRVQKSRFPHQGRVPFRGYVEDDLDTRMIRHHTFFAHLSIAREVIRLDRAWLCARDPHEAARARLYREVGQALQELADPQLPPRDPGSPLPPPRPGTNTRWALREAPRLRALARPEQVRARLGAVADQGTAVLVREALLLLGPATQGQISDLLAEILPPPPPPPGQNRGGFERSDDPDQPPEPIPIQEDDDPLDRMAVREAVLRCYQSLKDEDRDLLERLARGQRYEQIVAEVPRFRDPSAVSRALGTINREMKEALAARFGRAPEKGWGQKQLTELILAVLLLAMPGQVEVLP